MHDGQYEKSLFRHTVETGRYEISHPSFDILNQDMIATKLSSNPSSKRREPCQMYYHSSEDIFPPEENVESW